MIVLPCMAGALGGGSIKGGFLAHFDGTNGQTPPYTEVYGHSIVGSGGSPTLDTTSPAFGTASLLFSTSTVDINAANDIQLSGGDWCVEFLIKPSAGSGGIMGNIDSSNHGYEFFLSGYDIGVQSESAFVGTVGGSGATANQWNQVAIFQISNVVYIFSAVLGMTPVNRASGSLPTLTSSNTAVHMGSVAIYGQLSAHLDELRITTAAQSTRAARYYSLAVPIQAAAFPF